MSALFVTGKVISQKKDELNHILDQFNIQVRLSFNFTVTLVFFIVKSIVMMYK